MRNTGGFRREKTGNRWSMEAVYHLENFRIFTGAIRPISCSVQQKLTIKHRKESEIFPNGIPLPCYSDFRCFPPGYNDVSRIVPVDCGEIRFFPEIGNIDLGNFLAILQQYNISRILPTHAHLL
jgi:hypothetical protein